MARVPELAAGEQTAPFLSPWMRAAKAATYLDCSISYIEQLVRAGKLKPRAKSKRYTVYHRDDLDAAVASTTQGGVA